MKRIVNTNIRFDRNREEDRQAYENLRNIDRTKYKSYTRAVVAAVNDFFLGRRGYRLIPFWKPGRRKIVFCGRFWTRSGMASAKA